MRSSGVSFAFPGAAVFAIWHGRPAKRDCGAYLKTMMQLLLGAS